MHRYALFLLVFGGLLAGVAPAAGAQTGGNPLELIPRLPDSLRIERADTVAGREAVESEEAVEADPPEAPAAPPPPAVEPESRPRAPVDYEASYRRLKLAVTLIILIVLALLLTVLRSLIRRSVGAFLYPNLANQTFRAYEGRGFGPFTTMYTLFFLNGGVFLFYLSRYFGWSVHPNPLIQLLYCLGAVTGLYLAKHLVLGFLRFVFPPVQAAITRYNFIIMLFGITLGIFLVPVNLLLAYAPVGLQPVLVYGSLGLMGLAYAYRQIRAALNAAKIVTGNLFHFFLYICTIEIAPVLFLYQYALNQL